MNKKTSVILIAAIVFCLIVTAYTQTQRPAINAAQTWEYQEIRLSRTDSSKPKLDALGEQGWELVSVIAACEGDQYCSYYAYLKRRK